VVFVPNWSEGAASQSVGVGEHLKNKKGTEEKRNVRLLFCVLAAEVRSRDAGAAGLRGGDESSFFRRL
jgi:hypothetical protein